MTQFLLLLIVLLLTSPAQAAVLWFSGCEFGSVTVAGSNFGAVTGSPSCAAGAPQTRTGGFGLSLTANARWVTSSLGLAATDLYTRDYFVWTTNPAFDQHIHQYVNAARTHGMSIYLVDATKKICWKNDGVGACIATSTTVLTAGTYYRIDTHCVVSATVGGCELKIDGAVEFTSFGTDTSLTGTIDRVEFGPQAGAGTIQHSHDDMMVCSSAYCPIGRTIARQGTSGTPTYTAWSLNGGCSPNIQDCWSSTPFLTGANASSAVANDAQTMIVASFGATQANHGTETIAEHDTINGCMTSGIIKSGTAAAPLSIRRRLNGVDTDTSKTLTTADAYYDDGIWTTTTDNLRGVHVAEIGAVHGAGVATDTVEDMWMLCDYLAVTTPTRHRITQ